MKLEAISRLRGNEVLGKNIYTGEGRILLKAGTTLSLAFIAKMKEMGVYYVYIEDKNLEDVSVDDEKIGKLKQLTLESMSRVMRNVSLVADKKVMTDYVKIIEELVNYIISEADINKSLYDIQTHSNLNFIHSIDVCIMATFLGRALKMDGYSLRDLGVAAILHDIGKTALPKHITEKQGKLSTEEYKEYKEHSCLGANILKRNMRISEPIIKGVIQHHERVDGKGYPYGLEGKSISKFGKIISISNIYDLVTNNKSYKKHFSPNEAYELILGGSNTLFDEDIVKVFRKYFFVYPLGCCVKLSNGIEGYVVRQNDNFPDRPVVRVTYDNDTKKEIKSFEIDLIKSINLIIVGII